MSDALLNDNPLRAADTSDSEHMSDNEAVDQEHDLNAYDLATDVDSDDPDAGTWVRNLRGFPRIPPFTGNPGLKVDFGDDPEPIDVYRFFINDEIIHHIKRETNRYARTAIEEKERAGPVSKRSLFGAWKPVSVCDLRNFFAICIHIGLVKKLKIHDYWSKHPALHTSYAAQIMPRDRFLAILAFLHVNDNATYVPYGQPDHDPIHKIRPFMSHLQKKFAEAYVPEQKIALDEAMCPFKGRSRFKVYMKDKPVKWGFKFYEVCESSSGYVCRLEMFCADKRYSNKPHDVVLRLMDPLLHKGYHVYMDNYYCYEPLCNHLAGHGATMVCGTARKDGQTLPKKDFVNIPIEKGRLDYGRKDQVVLTKWRDKRDVLSLSTMDKPELVRTQGRFELKEKPRCVVNYIQHMAGVDNSDQLISYLPMHRKTLKWWKKPFFHLLTLTTIQTLILTNKHREIRNRKKLSLEDVNAAAGRRQPEARLEGGLKCHYASPVPESTTHTRKAYSNCKVCYDKLKKMPDMTRQELRKRRKITSFWCGKCEVALCVHPCFELYHSKMDYTA
ncbi:hypothetical protein BaRGS_00004459 [Batillaria attramentaria]|uniref:PiggyBac transposable element-derived protein domain-containing protein n=1 Tax=Batillaria attramentaria TaxID=370345 RepID=A0ABD0LWY0_9CAEN